MNPLNFLRRNKKKLADPTLGIDLNNVGWHKMGIGGISTYDFYRQNEYENAYSSIRVIANSFMAIEPYVINANGDVVQSNVIDRLYSPNADMSAVDFREALAVMCLIHPIVALYIHRNGDNITANNITGFTFIESKPYVKAGKRYWRLSNNTEVSTDEVIQIKSINPYELTNGFSPAQAGKRWTSLDDLIAEYQTGFFKNGAIPSGQFIITAATVQDFNDIVDNLQDKHRGASNNNNVAYVHRPIDPSGGTKDAQIEWIPFSTGNKELSLKELFDQANQKIDSVYGVPASLRGVNENNTYASVRIDEANFAKYHLNPFTLKIWSKFTHELNRLTGGAGIAVTFDPIEPTVADEQKVKADARLVDSNTMANLLTQGFELDSIVAYLQTGDLESLVMGEQEVEAEEDNPDVVDEGQAQDIDVEQKRVTPQIRNDYQNRVEVIAYNQASKQVARAEANVKSVEVPEKEVEQFTAELEATLAPLVAVEGSIQRAEGVKIILEAGLVVDDIEQFRLTDAQRADYKAYLLKVGNSYTDTIQTAIQAVLDRASDQQLTAGQIKQQLRNILAEKWRYERIARTEVERAGNIASVNAMENIANETGYSINKIWNTASAEPCEFCRALDGKVIGVSASYLDVGETLLGVDGGQLKNDFENVHAGTAHSNCRCYTTYEVVA